MALKIAVTNLKGGSGKTTTAVNLAYEFGHRGLRTAMFDLESQGNATAHLTGSPGTVPSIYDLLTGAKGVGYDDVARQALPAFPNVWVFPACVRLVSADHVLMQRNLREGILKRLIAPIEPQFDVMIFDLPPNLGILPTIALAAADKYLLPTDTSRYTEDGTRAVRRYADQLIADGVNTELELIGVLRSKFQKGNARAVRTIVDDLVEEYQEKLLPMCIPDSTKVIESQVRNLPVAALDPQCAAAVAFRELSLFIIPESKKSKSRARKEA